MSLEKRIDAEREFFETKPSMLVATEAAGEGINLQFCSLMVNYDIPWNPNRLEQRMGRIHRYRPATRGMIFNLVAKNTREGEVMDRLLRKLEDMRKALGSDRVYDVIGEIIPGPKVRLADEGLAVTPSHHGRNPRRHRPPNRRGAGRPHPGRHGGSAARLPLHRHAQARCRPAEKQGTPAHAGIHREVLRRGVPLLRRHHHAGQGQEGRLVHQPRAARSPQAARGDGAAVRQDRSVVLRRSHSTRTNRRVTPRSSSSARATLCSRAWSSGSSGTTARRCGREPSSTTPRRRTPRSSGSSSAAWKMDGGRPSANGFSPSTAPTDRFRKSQPYALLDLKGPETPRRTYPPTVRQTATNEDAVIDWSLDEVTPEYFARDQRAPRPGVGHQGEVRPQVAPVPHRRIGQEDRQVRQQLRPIRDENDPKRLSLQGNRAQEEARKAELSHRLKVA